MHNLYNYICRGYGPTYRIIYTIYYGECATMGGWLVVHVPSTPYMDSLCNRQVWGIVESLWDDLIDEG